MDGIEDKKRKVFDEVEERLGKEVFAGPPKEVLKKHLVPKALEKQFNLLDSSDEKVTQNAIDSVLDRGGVDRKQPQEKGNVNVLAIAPDVLKNLVSGMNRVIGDGNETVYEQRMDDE